MGKQTKRKACGTELGDATGVTKKGRRVSGVGVAQGAELLVIAGKESGAGVGATTDFEEASINVEAEFCHGIGLIDVSGGEEFSADGAEDLLRGAEDVAVFLAAPGDIEQADQDTFRAGPDRIVEVSGDSV